MPSPTQRLLALLTRWRQEHAVVAQQAYAINLQRLRLLLPLVAAVNAIHVLVFVVQWFSSRPEGLTRSWMLGLMLAHALMGCTLAAFAWRLHRAQLLRHSRLPQGMTLGVAAVAMAFQVAVVSMDQWVTPNITAFLIGCMVLAMALYLRPLESLLLYLGCYVLFAWGIGATQDNATQLLSNRLNGVSACVMGWALSVLLWRKFTLLDMQRTDLEKTHAELEHRQRALERLTRLDGLTGLFNRNTFTELTRRELARAQRQGNPTTLLLLDLDHFKRINDTWGHPAGDAVLRHVATLASTTVRSTDLVGRLGGEEFMVLLPNTTADAGRRLAEKLRQRLEASPVLWESTPIAVTASFGLASTTADARRDFDQLYTDADKALYLAKQRGRNQVV